MKPGLPFALTMIALVGSGVVLAAVNGHAGQPPANVPAVTEKHLFSPADRAAFLDARIAALHAGLTLSPEQEKLWPAVETAVRTAANNAMARRQKFKDAPAPASLVDRLRQRGENAVARGQNLEAIADAAAPLYAALSEDQKHRLPVLMHELRPHFFHRHFAMMGDGQEHWGRRGGWDESEGFAPDGGENSGRRER
ncbi:MAG: Spy/CpxP family protein refolding chaperone [Pseudomonadota bacterium]|nr:Spy/CpxP family protein refolding chaperone [Pseudomonadota bacterium]